MKITVTQEDIDTGSPASCTDCPIAVSITRNVGTRYVWVESKECEVSGRSLHLPPKARKFIKNYDNGIPVSPFSFELEGL